MVDCAHGLVVRHRFSKPGVGGSIFTSCENFYDCLDTNTVLLAIQNASRYITKIKKTKKVSAYKCGNDRCYTEIRNAPV